MSLRILLAGALGGAIMLLPAYRLAFVVALLVLFDLSLLRLRA